MRGWLQRGGHGVAVLAALLAVRCKDAGSSERAPTAQSCEDRWTALNGTMESTADACASFVGTSAEGAAGERYWLGHFELKQQPTTTTMDLEATISRPKSEEVYPVELSFYQRRIDR